MNFKQDLHHISIAVALCLGISACSSRPDVKEFPESASATKEIINFQVALENSQRRNIDFLAPENFTEAQNSLTEAQNLQRDKVSNRKILEEVALGRAYLERAEDIARENKGEMKDIFAARRAAIDAKAKTYFPGELKSLDKKVRIETARLEGNDKANVKDKRSDFITGYFDLELASIQAHYLGKSRNIIDRAEVNGAADLTPKSFQEANVAYDKANSYITDNRHDTEEIHARSAVALAAARKLDETITRARNLRDAPPEEAALRMQAEEERLAETEDNAAALAASNSTMSKEHQLNKIYDEARSKFSPSEADVYKQGQNLVIRLRGLEFPVNQAVLRGQNFPLLKKVDDIIGSFDKSSVSVEGHTDSTGGPKLNKKLSTARAQAVKDYLEANMREGATSFDSKGYGYEKPLASNKSLTGRAQNRRVDIVITPEQM